MMDKATMDKPTGDKTMKPETRAAQGLGDDCVGGDICPTTGAIIPPVHVSTTYARDADYAQIGGRGYIRADNPAFDPAERWKSVV